MNKHKKRVSWLAAAALTALFMASHLLPVTVRAQTPPAGLPAQSVCGATNLPSYQALIGASPDTYDVYVRLGRPGQVGNATLYAQSLQGGACQKIGAVAATGDAWRPLGQWVVNGANAASTFTLQSGDINEPPAANRPTVLLVSHSHPACLPAAECTTTVNGQTGVIRASGTLLNEDTLHVVKALDPATDKLQNVVYYIDDRAVYTTPTLQDFNLRYVSPGPHILSRVATYKSGQSIVFTTNFDRGWSDDLSAFFTSAVYGQNTLLKILLAAFSISLLGSIFLTITRAIHKHHIWKVTHFPQPLQPVDNSPHYIKPDGPLKKLTKNGGPILGIVAASILAIAILNGYVMQIYQVDGPSMQTTLYTGQHLAVNRLGQTWAHLSRKKYIPKRGTIIIFKKETSTLLTLDAAQEQAYVVKRVIGLPGERVTVKDGLVTVFNDKNPQGFNPDAGHPWASNIQPTPKDESVDVTLGPDELFVSGDNRPESVDSRAYGAIKSSNIIGQAVLRLPPSFRWL